LKEMDCPITRGVSDPGGAAISRLLAAEQQAAAAISADIHPRVTLKHLNRKPIAPDDLNGRMVLVEFWATWSALAQVRATVASLNPGLRWAITYAATAQPFGNITSVPTLFFFAKTGRPGVSFTAPCRDCTTTSRRRSVK
jgi:hypothetical protein